MKKIYLILFISALFSGCAHFSNNLKKIEPGMTLDEVTQIMGKPDASSTDKNKTAYVYESGKTSCTVLAEGNKVTDYPKCTKDRLSESISETASMRMLTR